MTQRCVNVSVQNDLCVPVYTLRQTTEHDKIKYVAKIVWVHYISIYMFLQYKRLLFITIQEEFFV